MLARVVAALLLQATMAMAARVQGLKQALTSVSPELIRAAAARIEPHASRTPILRSDQIDARAACSIHVKAEHLQTTGSFKYRGALNAVLSLSDEEASRGVVAHSTGNHGAAVARAAKARGAPCCIVVPRTTLRRPGKGSRRLSARRSIRTPRLPRVVRIVRTHLRIITTERERAFTTRAFTRESRRRRAVRRRRRVDITRRAGITRTSSHVITHTRNRPRAARST